MAYTMTKPFEILNPNSKWRPRGLKIYQHKYESSLQYSKERLSFVYLPKPMTTCEKKFNRYLLKSFERIAVFYMVLISLEQAKQNLKDL